MVAWKMGQVKEKQEGWNKREQEQNFRVMNVLITLIVVIVSWVCTNVKTDQIKYFNYVQIIAHQLHLSTMLKINMRELEKN